MFTDVGDVLLGVGGVQHQEEGLFTHAVNDQVIHAPAVLVQHNRVSAAADFQVVKLIGQDGIQIFQRVRSLQKGLSHMGDIKNAGLFPHSLVLGDNAARILHRQQEPAEGDDFTAQFHMEIVKRCLFVHKRTHFLSEMFVCAQNKKRRAAGINLAALRF